MTGTKEEVVTKVDHNQGVASWVDVTTTREAVTATIETEEAIITIEVVTKVVIIIIIITDKTTPAIITTEKVLSVAIIDRLEAMTLHDKFSQFN